MANSSLLFVLSFFLHFLLTPVSGLVLPQRDAQPSTNIQKREINWRPDFHLTNGGDQDAIFRDFLNEVLWAQAMADNAARIDPSSAEFRFYFGTPNQQQTNAVRDVFQRIANLDQHYSEFRVEFWDTIPPNFPNDQTVAAIFRTGSGQANQVLQIYLPAYNNYPRHGTVRPYRASGTPIDRYRSRAAILLHEFTHMRNIGQWFDGNGRMFTYTVDVQFPDNIPPQFRARQHAGQHAYGSNRANALALWDPTRAASNADNYAMFAIYTWLGLLNPQNRPADTDLPPGDWDFGGSRKWVPDPLAPWNQPSLKTWWRDGL